MFLFFLDIKNNSKKLLFFFLISYSSISQSYKTQWVDAALGLNQLSVRTCVQDNDGFVWIATELGLFRYDGKIAIRINDSRYPEISKRRTLRLVKDNTTGIIYFVTDQSFDTFCIKDGKIESVANNTIGVFLTYNDYLNAKIITKKCVAVLNKNKILEFNKFNLYDASVLVHRNSIYYIRDKYIACLNYKGVETKIAYPTSKNTQFILCDNSVFIINNNKIHLIKGNKLLPENIVADKILINFIKLKNLNLTNLTLFQSGETSYLNFSGKIYKLSFSNDKITTQFLLDTKLNDIRCFNYSKKENLYLIGTTTMGLAIIKPNKIRTYFNGSNYYINCNYAVVEKDSKWYSYNGWQYNYKTNKSKTNKIIDYNGNVSFLLNYKNKYYYEAKKNRLVSIQNSNDVAPIKFGLENASFTSYTYLDNKLWISTQNNLSCLKVDSLKIDLFFKQQLKPKTVINAISNFNNSLLVATSNGVYKYKPLSKKVYKFKCLEKVNARYIKPIDSKSFWLGCYGDGLYLVKNNKAYKVIDKNIELDTAHAIEEDKNGNLWISTNNGLLTIFKSTIINNTLHKLPVTCYRFTVNDGLLTNEFNGGSTHPSLQTKEGIIGFPSMKGFVWFDPKNVQKIRFSGTIIIDEIVLDNKESATLKDGAFVINKYTEILKLNFSYGYKYNRENLTVSYRFEDQKKWTEITGNSFQIARHKNGIHKLQIRITTNGFNENQGVVKTIKLNFEPRYYETLWFWSIIAILITLLACISYLLGINLKKKNEIQLKNKIYERTKELNLSILELKMSKESLDKSLQVKNVLLKEIHHRVKNNLQLVMSILNIQASDKENTSIEGFIEKGQSRIASMVLIHENLYQKEDIGNIDFETYTESLVNNIRTTFGEISERIDVYIKMENVFFDIQTSIPLGLIINELVTNSFKHGFPNEKSGLITISIEQINNTNYKLAIEDTGIGFPKDKEDKKSIGLELVSLLVLQLKGKLTIDSKNGTAFEINFTIT